MQFYESDQFLEKVVSAYLAEGLRHGAGLLVVVTEEHWAAFQRRLSSLSPGFAEAERERLIQVLDARRVRAQVFVDAVLNEHLFRGLIASALDRMLRRAPGGRVCAFGELVDLLWSEGQAASALHVERLWCEVLSGRGASLLCAYRMKGADGAQHASALEDICGMHSRVVPTESFLQLDTDEERFRAISLLQHKAYTAHALQSEIQARRAEEEVLRRRGRELDEEARQKDQFIAVLGHELRNPLAAIVVALQVARSGRQGAAERAYAVVDRQVNKMAHLIEDLLDVTRLSHGKINLRPEPVEVVGCVEQVVEALRPLLDARRQRLSLDLPAEPMHLYGDPVRVEQILSNLLQNALKYTANEGEIELRASVEGAMVEIAVQDNGQGMAAHLLERVFEPFAQGVPGDTRSEGGLGLGLALVRGLVELHGGSVRALSDGPGCGSTFIVRLPLAGEAAPAASHRVSPALRRAG